jgi:hypothetical protein
MEAMRQNGDKGYFHLTPRGWVRQDQLPHPEDRVETWLYQPEPEESAEIQLCLTRVWIDPGMTVRERDALRAKFARPQRIMAERNLMRECLV